MLSSLISPTSYALCPLSISMLLPVFPVCFVAVILSLIKVLLGSKPQAHICLDICILVILYSHQAYLSKLGFSFTHTEELLCKINSNNVFFSSGSFLRIKHSVKLSNVIYALHLRPLCCLYHGGNSSMLVVL